jgi:hypothetical protein
MNILIQSQQQNDTNNFQSSYVALYLVNELSCVFKQKSKIFNTMLILSYHGLNPALTRTDRLTVGQL